MTLTITVSREVMVQAVIYLLAVVVLTNEFFSYAVYYVL